MDRTTAVTGSAIMEQPRSQELVSCEVGVTHARVSVSDVVVGSCVRSKQASSPDNHTRAVSRQGCLDGNALVRACV